MSNDCTLLLITFYCDFSLQADLLILSYDFMTDVPLHQFVDVYRLHDATITMMLCPEQKELETVPGVKQKKKGKLLCWARPCMMFPIHI